MSSKNDLTQEWLKELLHYDPETGAFKWLVDRSSRHKAGSMAGSFNSKGYLQIMIQRRNYLAHRLAWLYMTGSWPEDQVDHRDLNKANNRWSNLRAANDSQNQQNKAATRNVGSSGLLGVTWSKAARKWAAQIKVNGKRIYLGLFVEAEDAHQAYLAAKRELHPFGNL